MYLFTLNLFILLFFIPVYLFFFLFPLFFPHTFIHLFFHSFLHSFIHASLLSSSSSILPGKCVVTGCDMIDPVSSPDGCGTECHRLGDQCFSTCPGVLLLLLLFIVVIGFIIVILIIVCLSFDMVGFVLFASFECLYLLFLLLFYFLSFLCLFVCFILFSFYFFLFLSLDSYEPGLIGSVPYCLSSPCDQRIPLGNLKSCSLPNDATTCYYKIPEIPCEQDTECVQVCV
jgi:hypothetical protein